MKIKSIYVNNFKSLVDFKIDLTNFNCLVGVNGSGKSTFLEFVDFLVHLMIGDIEKWLRHHKWNESDLFNPYQDKKISFRVAFCDDFNGNNVSAWCGEYVYAEHIEPKYRLSSEKIDIGDFEVFSYQYTADFVTNPDSQGQQYMIVDKSVRDYPVRSGFIKSDFLYQGSIFSALQDKQVPQVFYDVRDFILSVESVGVLSLYLMNQPTGLLAESIGANGINLPSFIDELACDDLVKSIAALYPQLRRIQVKEVSPVWGDFYSTWKQLYITEQFQDNEYTITSNCVSGGFLRLLAILAQLNLSKKAVVLFDEIENGIDQEKIEFLAKTFVNTKSQTVVTTHSPLFLNYLDDDTARKSITYFYKTQEGYTQCIPLFDIPYIDEKLGVMGAGEAYSDTDLTGLNLTLGHPDTRKQLLSRKAREEN
jgi:ABC-type transport system involved in cytochrome c biogenesis ATPase subunit